MSKQHRDATESHPQRDWSVWLATGLGVGLIAWPPGTIGGLWGLPLAWGLAHVSLVGQSLVIVALAIVGIPVCTRAAARLGGRKDPGAIVFDEIVSVPITFLFVSAAQMNRWQVLLLGFLLNRLFDITKPPPARQLERLSGGLGIMADDWAAGAYSCLSLHALLWADRALEWHQFSGVGS